MGKNVYLNGQIIPLDEATISVTDRGFLYGDGLIETIRTYCGVPFMLKSHLLRLIEAAQALNIKIGLDFEQLKLAIFDLIKANDVEDGAIRITLTRGNSVERNLYEEIDKANLLITITSLDAEKLDRARNGVEAISGEDKRSMYGRYKNSSMLATIMAYKEAIDKGAFDIIQITRRGFVTEASRSNVFVVLDNILLTPPIGSRVLPGITRKIAIDIAKRNDIKVEEDAIVGQDLASSEEIFLTNSLFEIVPVLSLNGNPVAKGQKGPITSCIQKGYQLLVNTWLEQIHAPSPAR